MKQSPTRFGSPTYEKSNSLLNFENNRKTSNFSESSQAFQNQTSSPSLLGRNLERILDLEQKVLKK